MAVAAQLQPAGRRIIHETFEEFKSLDTFAAFATVEYGQKTQCQASTHFERLALSAGEGKTNHLRFSRISTFYKERDSCTRWFRRCFVMGFNWLKTRLAVGCMVDIHISYIFIYICNIYNICNICINIYNVYNIFNIARWANVSQRTKLRPEIPCSGSKCQHVNPKSRLGKTRALVLASCSTWKCPRKSLIGNVETYPP